MLGVRAGALKVYKDTLFIADTYNRCIRSVATKGALLTRKAEMRPSIRLRGAADRIALRN
jgi:hypothetical protein